MNEILKYYRELNPNNYDPDDAVTLIHWASDAYDEIARLQMELDDANKVLAKIKEIL